jgi:small conductance mechanosensitive channel
VQSRQNARPASAGESRLPRFDDDLSTTRTTMDFQGMYNSAKPALVAFGLKVAIAIVLYIVGRVLIGFAGTLIQRALERQKVEPTVIRYIGNAIAVALNILLVIGILGYFGVETTSFAALIAALGIAIGAAWGGLLSNFAAGAFILVLRPFKVGDYVSAGEVEGTVRAIGLFTTAIDTPDNVQTYVGNAKIMNGTIRNFSANPHRRVDLTAQLDHSVDPADAVRRLREALPKIANVVADPKPDVEILTFNERGPVLAVRPYVHTDNYWQVYFDTNRAIRETFGAAGYPAAEAHVHVRHKAA